MPDTFRYRDTYPDKPDPSSRTPVRMSMDEFRKLAAAHRWQNTTVELLLIRPISPRMGIDIGKYQVRIVT